MPQPNQPNTPATTGNPSQLPSASPAQPQAPIVVGGPGATTDGPTSGNPTDAASLSVAPPVEPAQATQPSTVIVGDKVFNSEKEAIAFFSERERERAVQDALRAQNQSASPVVPAKPEPKISELLFEDPETALKIVEERAVQRVEARQIKQQAQVQVWGDFYAKHPDLKGFEDVVEFQRARSWQRVKDLPLEQSLPILANQARAYISKIRGTANPGEQLPSKPAMVAGASGPTAPAAPAQSTKVMTFSDEVAALRRRRA